MFLLKNFTVGAPGLFGWLSIQLLVSAQVAIPGPWDWAPRQAPWWQCQDCLGSSLSLSLSQKQKQNKNKQTPHLYSKVESASWSYHKDGQTHRGLAALPEPGIWDSAAWSRFAACLFIFKLDRTLLLQCVFQESLLESAEILCESSW